MAVLSGLEDPEESIARSTRESCSPLVCGIRSARFDIMLKLPSDGACFARESAQHAAKIAQLKTIRALPFSSLLLMLIVEGACSRSPSGMTT